MRQIIAQSIRIYLILTVITGLIYPLFITMFAQLAWKEKANGSLIVDKESGKVIGSELLGQEFSAPGYFWGRLSSTSQPYDAGASSGSNLGPTNPAIVTRAKQRIDTLNQLVPSQSAVPIDLVTASGSGLDPHISIAAAEYQVIRVAQVRKVQESRLLQLIKKATVPKDFNCLGEPSVNVLKLNIALDQLDSRQLSEKISNN